MSSYFYFSCCFAAIIVPKKTVRFNERTTSEYKIVSLSEAYSCSLFID